MLYSFEDVSLALFTQIIMPQPSLALARTKTRPSHARFLDNSRQLAIQ